MSGKTNGVQALFKKKVPQSIYIHCFNHKLNLVLVDVCKNIKESERFFCIVERLYVFFSGSNVHARFIDTQKTMGIDIVELKQICFTRWTSQIYSCIAIRKRLEAVLVTLNLIASEGGSRTAESEGLLNEINFVFVFQLIMFENFLKLFKILSDYLQSTTADMTHALTLVSSLLHTFESLRNSPIAPIPTVDVAQRCNEDLYFKAVFDKAITIAQKNNIVTEVGKKLMRPKKMPKKYESFFITENNYALEGNCNDNNNLMVNIFIPVLDKVILELRKRFEENSDVLKGISSLNPADNDNFLNLCHLENFARHYKCNIDILTAELKIVHNSIECYEREHNIKIDNIFQLMHFLFKYKIAFNETYKLVLIAITIPVSSASCERSFSCLRLIKSYLRNRMGNDRLSSLAILSIEKSLVKKINLENVIDIFATNKKRRLDLIL